MQLHLHLKLQKRNIPSSRIRFLESVFENSQKGCISLIISVCLSLPPPFSLNPILTILLPQTSPVPSNTNKTASPNPKNNFPSSLISMHFLFPPNNHQPHKPPAPPTSSTSTTSTPQPNPSQPSPSGVESTDNSGGTSGW